VGKHFLTEQEMFFQPLMKGLMMARRKTLIFKADKLIPVIHEARANKSRILLVKDHGVYMMSAVGQKDESGSHVHLAYADGCNPNVDEEFYDNACDIMGGDDSCQELEYDDEMFDIILKEKRDLRIAVSSNSFDFYI